MLCVCRRFDVTPLHRLCGGGETAGAGLACVLVQISSTQISLCVRVPSTSMSRPASPLRRRRDLTRDNTQARPRARPCDLAVCRRPRLCGPTPRWPHVSGREAVQRPRPCTASRPQPPKYQWLSRHVLVQSSALIALLYPKHEYHYIRVHICVYPQSPADEMRGLPWCSGLTPQSRRALYIYREREGVGGEGERVRVRRRKGEWEREGEGGREGERASPWVA